MTTPDLTARLRRHVARFDVQLALCVQLAIEEVLADQDLRRRIDQDPGFGQLAHDALYALSRQWEADQPEYDARDQALKGYLDARLREQREATDGAEASKEDVVVLAEANRRLIGHLTDLGALQKRLGASTDVVRRGLSRFVPVAVAPALLRRKSGGEEVFAFNFDAYGRDLRPRRTVKVATEELLAMQTTAVEFLQLLKTYGVTVEDLTFAGLLPPTLDSRTITAALGAAERPDTVSSAALTAATATLDAVRATLDQQGGRIGAALRIARRLAADADRPDFEAPQGIRLLERFPVLGRLPSAGRRWTRRVWHARLKQAGFPDLGEPSVLDARPETLRLWTSAASEKPARGQVGHLPPEALWAEWTPRLLRQVPGLQPVPYDNLVAAARGELPVAALRQDLARTSPFDWSLVALAALPGPELGPGRRSALVACLAGLRFDNAALERVATAPGLGGWIPSSGDLTEAGMAIARSRGRGGKAYLVIYDDSQNQPLTPNSGRPLFYVPRRHLETYAEGIDWLVSLDVFEGLMEEGHG